MDVDAEKFQKTVSRELRAIRDRVRYLIGSSHWGEEGRYKEAILRSVIRRFVPATINLGTGFILSRNREDVIKVSNQIDIIVYDNTYPVLFQEGDFIVTTPENVKGIIEVKTNLDISKLAEVISKSTENGHLLKREVFNGVFVYGTKSAELVHRQRLSTELQNSKGTINHICLGKDIFIKYWEHPSTQLSMPNEGPYYRVYKIDDLSFSYFISNLVESISSSNIRERLWFLYPISKGKEQYKIKDIPIT